MSERADWDGVELPKPKAVDLEDATLARFDPLLRALITFRLVQPADGDADSGHWELTAAVQRRLESLVTPAPPAEKLIYFGHRCSSCGEHGPTRISSGAFLCDSCRKIPVEELAPRREALGGPRSA
ncbi:MAG: hypothetical protein ACRDVW_04665 [Acidimicrobiales bacterium]